jgi:Zn-dependent protease with chaperone function
MKIYIKKGDQVSGPFSKDELSDKIYSGEFTRSVLAGVEGSTDWVPLESLLAAKAPPVAIASPTVTADRLRDPKEKTALIWLYIASVPMWLFLLFFVVGGMGIPLIIIGVFWLFHLFGELWFAAYLKTNAIRVSERQLPELNRAVDLCCKNLGMERPDVYVLQYNVWNAFATKIFGQRMVVLLSGAVDSILLKGDMSQLTWLVGHELGHHWAGHLNFSQKIAKLGNWLIWVALWHSRRAEFTCDRVGLYCAGSLKASQLALINATVGAQLAAKVNVEEAANQWEQHSSEFFVKYRTLYSTHPHLLARLVYLNQAARELGMA